MLNLLSSKGNGTHTGDCPGGVSGKPGTSREVNWQIVPAIVSAAENHFCSLGCNTVRSTAISRHGWWVVKYGMAVQLQDSEIRGLLPSPNQSATVSATAPPSAPSFLLLGPTQFQAQLSLSLPSPARGNTLRLRDS